MELDLIEKYMKSALFSEIQIGFADTQHDLLLSKMQ